MRRLIGGLVGGGAAIFAGVSATGDETTRNDTGAIVDGGGLGVFAIHNGDCIQLPSAATEVESVEGVPCTDPHDAQVYAEYDLPGGDFPGQSVLDEQGARGCYDRWQAAVGTVYEQDTVLDFTYFSPQREGWNAGDHEIQCMIVRMDGSRMIGDQLG